MKFWRWFMRLDVLVIRFWWWIEATFCVVILLLFGVICYLVATGPEPCDHGLGRYTGAWCDPRWESH